MGRTFQEQRITSLQHDLTRGLLDALASAGNGDKGQVVVTLKGAIDYLGIDQTAAEIDVAIRN